MAHGFGAHPSGPLGLVGQRLAEAGVAAMAFDFRHFGSSEGTPRQVLKVQPQLDDWAAAVAYARSREDVDAERIGLWGSSLTGGEVLAVAARDSSIAAVVAQAPYTDGYSIARAAGIRHNLRLLPAVLRDLLRERLGRAPHLIDALGEPGSPAAISTRYADLYRPTVERAPQWQNKIAARALVEIYRFRPLLQAREIACPLLVVLSYIDRVAPPGPAMRAVEGLPYVELAMLQARHFELYLGQARERALRTEVSFLAYHLTKARAEGPEVIRNPPRPRVASS